MKTLFGLVKDQRERKALAAEPRSTTREVRIVRYKSPRKYEKAAPEMVAHGWTPASTSNVRARGLRLMGKGILVTWVRETPVVAS